MIRAIAICFVFLGTSCATTWDAPSRALVESSVAEPAPAPEECQAFAAEYLRQVLKDPAPTIEWPDAASKGWVKRDEVPLTGQKGGVAYGWTYTPSVNARNGFGGYTGFKPWVFVWSQGACRAVVGPEHGLVMLDESWFLAHRTSPGDGHVPGF